MEFRMPWTQKEQSLKLSFPPYSEDECFKSEVLIDSQGLFQIGGDLESERGNKFSKGIGLARLVTNNLSDPFAFFRYPKEYLVTLIPEPFDPNYFIKGLGIKPFEDLQANPIYMIKDKRGIGLIDPLRKESIEVGYVSLESFGGESSDFMQGGCNRVKLRFVPFRVEVKGYKPALFEVFALR